ncbi:hypothetical protein TS85_11355 [Sphingomonas hengshuiensis]|uniref:Lysozyme n=1 Tax=Sphingomonas hengshuiensis TaxID=1609977 RepID=A0A7U5BFS0_9SPHN|nr:hypothetical protein TS85_11355 [Sphingomonas hengshuiensis]
MAAAAATAKSTPRRTLAEVVGVGAAMALLVLVPREESGRMVKAQADPVTSTVTVRHVSGPQHLKAYLDIVGVATACDGITRGVRIGQTYTEAQCAALLERELVAHAEPVLACTPWLRGEGREGPRVAAVSLAYNIGVHGFCRSTAARRFSAGDWRGGCDAFLMWTKAGGREVRGLRLRRERERAECLQGINSSKGDGK